MNPPTGTPQTPGEPRPKDDLLVLIADLHLGAFLMCKGVPFKGLQFDVRGRATLMFEGREAIRLRAAYHQDEVSVHLPKFKGAYNALRDLLCAKPEDTRNPEGTHAHTRSPLAEGQGRNQSA